MKDILKIALYLVATILLASLLAPLLFWMGRAIVEGDWLAFLGDTAPREYLYRVMATSDFERYFNRAVLISAVILLAPLIFWMRIRSWRDFGLRRNPRWLTDAGVGVGAAAVPMLILAAILIGGGWYEWADPLPWRRVGSILMTAVGVSLVEETFFRGAMLGLVRRTAGKWTALLFVSAVFSILHFMKPPDLTIEEGEVGWESGFALLPHTFEQFSEPLLLMGGFTTLLLVGWILGWTVLKTGSLWLAFGLHAGWVLALQTFNRFTRREADELWPWFGPDLLTGLGPLLVVGLTGVGVMLYVRRGQTVARMD